MPLTAEDVKNKQFTPTRFKGGYDEKEVDDFLDEVEAELTRLTRENSDLRARLQVAEQAARQAASAPPAAAAPPQPFAMPSAPGVTATAPAVPAAPVAPAAPAAAPTAAPEAGGGASGQGTQEAALRMLTMAQKTADDTIADARRDAGKMLSDARSKAEQLERETQEHHRSVVGNLDSERERLEREVEGLRSFEREYRARLKSYLEGQLRDLEGRGDGVAPRPAPMTGGPSSAPGLAPSAPPSTGGQSPVPGVQAPARPASPFAPAVAPPVPGAQPPTSDSSAGPSGPPRQAPAGGFEVDEGPEVPPSHG